MKTQLKTNLGITQLGVTLANNRYPSFIGANSEDGVTVTKALHSKVFEEVYLMYVTRLNHHEFTTVKSYDIPVHQVIVTNACSLNKYEVKRKGNTFYIQKTNWKGKVFKFALHVVVENGELQYKYVWKKKPKKFIDGYRIKMRMFAPQQLASSPVKLYKIA